MQILPQHPCFYTEDVSISVEAFAKLEVIIWDANKKLVIKDNCMEAFAALEVSAAYASGAADTSHVLTHMDPASPLGADTSDSYSQGGDTS